MIAETIIDVRYPDCDRMGIVHHAVYPVWYEVARMDFFEKTGCGYPIARECGINPAMVDLHVRYKAPVTYPGTVTIRTKLVFCAPKKLELQYEAFFDGRLCGSARSFHIWTGPDMKSLDMEKTHPEIYDKIKAAVEM